MFTLSTAARTTVIAASIGLSALGGVGAAAVAHAAVSSTLSADDSRFIEGMAEQGIVFDTPDQGVGLAHDICGEFARGTSFDTIAAEGIHQTDLTPYQVGYLIGGSVGVYCPQYHDELPA
ncbi:hypothetical protein GCM10023094_25290 [Rhodococcus olei]|uniref:DUF732 domain-containing protein n=1 Tax=Rhodococcus olei TaxID=2161675 RepID=A0ABP8P4J6_9NOCA